MDFATRSLSPYESRIVLALSEQRRREIDRSEVARTLEISLPAADQLIRSLRRKGWLERASWGRYLLIPPEQGPDALGESNLLALASRIASPYYIGYGTAATHYGFTTQLRNVIWLVTPQNLRDRHIQDAQVRIVKPTPRKFFGFAAVDVYGYEVMMSDREKTVIDCIDRPDRAGGVGEAAIILGAASGKLDWLKLVDYLDRIGSSSLARRLGWLADHVAAPMPDEVRERLQRSVSKSGRMPVIGPARPSATSMGRDSVWQVMVTAAPDELSGSAGLGRRHSVRRGP
jgi:predicted transcriptional regulator of viral defense system